MDRQQYLTQLDAIERAARGNHFHRLAFAPGHYLRGMFFAKLWYPLQQRSLKRRAATFFGEKMEVLLPAGLDLYLLGAKSHDSEIRLARFMIRHLAPGATVVDIGAHYGFYSLLCAQLVGPSGKVLSIEAAGTTFALLQANTAPFPQIDTLHAAAADTDGSITFYEFPALYSEYNTSERSQFESAAWRRGIQPAVVRVDARRLDGLFEAHALAPGFLKMDVEGAEASAVAGLEKWALKRTGCLAMEYLGEQAERESHRSAAALLRSWGWAAFAIRSDGRLEACADIEAYLKAQQLDSDNIIFQPVPA